ncbi:hypothetical protein [Sphingomonas astaxanthinifaciens]|uniref:Uncharacterized protein n=1 Tax=Sphingomonas astaxanthinifaciens DSM 22298 TaxID=1123267 RepID=A0ABQ5ZA38_9SPHN|nr:hypothetical protein [Sphingomonas astaxanthinifaciens]GLR47467.1 hypothetical protein GCM10007925_11790 [Sphingomonas astaxanthinifaciens DSM 22298]
MLILFLAASLAQSAPAEPIANAARAFSGCIRGKLATAPAELSPEAAADALIGQCGAEKAGLDAAFASILEKVPDAEKAAAQKEYDDGIAEGRQGVIDAITTLRANAAAAAKGQPMGR